MLCILLNEFTSEPEDKQHTQLLEHNSPFPRALCGHQHHADQVEIPWKTNINILLLHYEMHDMENEATSILCMKCYRLTPIARL